MEAKLKAWKAEKMRKRKLEECNSSKSRHKSISKLQTSKSSFKENNVPLSSLLPNRKLKKSITNPIRPPNKKSKKEECTQTTPKQLPKKITQIPLEVYMTMSSLLTQIETASLLPPHSPHDSIESFLKFQLDENKNINFENEVFRQYFREIKEVENFLRGEIKQLRETNDELNSFVDVANTQLEALKKVAAVKRAKRKHRKIEKTNEESKTIS